MATRRAGGVLITFMGCIGLAFGKNTYLRWKMVPRSDLGMTHLSSWCGDQTIEVAFPEFGVLLDLRMLMWLIISLSSDSH
jgi:hypothetical protein